MDLDSTEQQEYDEWEIDMRQFLPDRVERFVNVKELTGPIQRVENIPGKGRGLKATKSIRPGQLIMVSRAFEIIFHYKDSEPYSVVNAVAKKLTEEPGLREMVYELHQGQEVEAHSLKPRQDEPKQVEKSDPTQSASSLDMTAIKNICNINCFQSCKPTTNSRGLWILPSYINHDCIDFNCNWDVCGDMYFLRATRTIQENEELLVSYLDSTFPLEKRSEFLKHYNFECKCRLCIHQRNEDASVKNEKSFILQCVQELPDHDKTDVSNIEQDIEYLEKCITDFEELGKASGKPEWNFGVIPLFEKLLKLYSKIHKFEAEKATTIKLYYVLNGCPQIGGDGMTICIDPSLATRVIYFCLKLKDWEGARTWVSILKKDLSSVYGKSDVFGLLFPLLYNKVVQNGIVC